MAIGGWLGKTLGLPKMEQVIPMILSGGQQPARESAPINLQQTIETADAGSSSGMMQARSGFTGRDIVSGAIGGIANEVFQDANWDRWTDFGDVDVSNVCRTGSSAPWTRTSTGCVTVSRKQQAKLKEAVEMLGISTVANAVGLEQPTLVALLMKRFPRRGKGITASSMRTTRRTIRQVKSLHNDISAMAGRRTPVRRAAAVKQVKYSN